MFACLSYRRYTRLPPMPRYAVAIATLQHLCHTRRYYRHTAPLRLPVLYICQVIMFTHVTRATPVTLRLRLKTRHYGITFVARFAELFPSSFFSYCYAAFAQHIAPSSLGFILRLA